VGRPHPGTGREDHLAEVWPGGAVGEVSMSQEVSSLYDRLGGVYNISVVVDDLIDRVMVDARLNANPRVDEAHHRVTPPGFKYYVTEMLCQAAGGPQMYSGRSMGDSHRHLAITEEEFGAFMDDLQQTLDKFGVPDAEQQEVTGIVEGTKESIVVEPLQEEPARAAGPGQ
jgi:hemoglobin